jgi:hypothetical protein
MAGKIRSIRFFSAAQKGDKPEIRREATGNFRVLNLLIRPSQILPHNFTNVPFCLRFNGCFSLQMRNILDCLQNMDRILKKA